MLSAQGREALGTREVISWSWTIDSDRCRIIYSSFHREKSCYSRNHRSILEQSQGDNSHPSETNLIEGPLKQQLPGASYLFPNSRRTVLLRQEPAICSPIPGRNQHETSRNPFYRFCLTLLLKTNQSSWGRCLPGTSGHSREPTCWFVIVYILNLLPPVTPAVL